MTCLIGVQVVESALKVFKSVVSASACALALLLPALACLITQEKDIQRPGKHGPLMSCIRIVIQHFLVQASYVRQ